MKKITALLLAVVIVCVMGMAFFSASETSYIFGDVDGDGEVSTLDSTYIKRIIARLQSADEEMITRGDVDGDGELTILDATYIMRYLARQTTPYPIGERISAPTEAPTDAPTQAPTRRPTVKPDPYELPPI